MPARTEERDELRRELDRSREEVARLREMLTVQDEELGEVKGQLAELENLTRGLMVAAGRVQQRVPRLFRIALGIGRRLARLLRLTGPRGD